MRPLYSRDLAFIHDSAFTASSDRAAQPILTLLHDAGIERGRIVEIGCGSGRLASRLSKHGHRVAGFDVSAAMIALARVNAPRATFRVASLSALKIPACDALIALGEVVTYVPGGLPVLRAFFSRVHAALAPGGLFIFDFMRSARGRTYSGLVHSGDGWTLAVRADYNRRTHVLTRRMAIVRRAGRRNTYSREVHRVRVYDAASIVRTLRRIGFRVSIGRSIGSYRLMKGDSAVVARRL